MACIFTRPISSRLKLPEFSKNLLDDLQNVHPECHNGRVIDGKCKRAFTKGMLIAIVLLVTFVMLSNLVYGKEEIENGNCFSSSWCCF